MTNDEQILTRLPQATIDRLPDTRRDLLGEGHCDKRPSIQFGKIVLLVDGITVVVQTDEVSDGFRFQFRFADWDKDAKLVQGATYPCTPWNHYNEVRLIANRRMAWTRTKHLAQDAYTEKENSTVFCRMNTCDEDASDMLGPFDPSKHVIIPGGWDHDHCSMCWATISQYCEKEAEQWGYESTEGEWLCDECHEKYILRGTLDFLIK